MSAPTLRHNDQAVSPPHSSQRLSFRIKVLYSVGEIANSIKVVTFGLYSLFFATSVLQLPGTWIGAAGFFAMFWDAVIDPFIGYFADGGNHDARRMRLMLTGSLTMGFSFWAFFSPPTHAPREVVFVWLIITSLLVRTATSAFTIPYYSLGFALTSDYHERNSIAALRGLAGMAGTLFTASLSFILFFPDSAPGVDPKMNRQGYEWMGLAFGSVMTAVTLTTIFCVRKTPMNAAPSHPSALPRHFFRALRISLGNAAFRILLAATGLAVAALALNGSMMLHFSKYVAGIHSSSALSSSQASFFAASIFGSVIWLRVATKFDKHLLVVISASATAALLLSASLFFGEGNLLGIGNVPAFLAGYAITGFFHCTLWFMPQSMLADVADQNRMLTGDQNEGALFGVLSFTLQLATGFGVMIAGVLLQYFVRIANGAGTQSPAVVYRIGLVYSVVPAFMFLMAAALMYKYPLTRAKVTEIQTAIGPRI